MERKLSAHDLTRLQRQIGEKLGWGPISSWHSSMFQELSEQVFEETQVMLSVPTLKRFFGVVKHDGTPSITTLDALARFVGNENWRVFKLTNGKKGTRVLKPRKSVYVTVGFILALVTISLIGNKRPEVVINSSEFSFTSKVLSKEYPNSVVFDFEIPGTLRADSLKIQQYWDPTKTIDISKDQSQATGIYYFPGYFRAKLLADGKEAKAHDLFLKSNGWLGSIDYQPVPKYFHPISDENSLTFPKEIMDEVSVLEGPRSSTFHFVDNLGNISGDNFSLKSTIESTFDDRWAVCQTLRIFCLGTTGAMIIPFSKIGCSSDNNLMLNDVYLRGKETDLSALSADFSSPVDLEIQVQDKQITVFIDGSEVYTNTYTESMGRLVGLRFRFLGLGEVLDYELRDHQNIKIRL